MGMGPARESESHF